MVCGLGLRGVLGSLVSRWGQGFEFAGVQQYPYPQKDSDFKASGPKDPRLFGYFDAKRRP